MASIFWGLFVVIVAARKAFPNGVWHFPLGRKMLMPPIKLPDQQINNSTLCVYLFVIFIKQNHMLCLYVNL